MNGGFSSGGSMQGGFSSGMQGGMSGGSSSFSSGRSSSFTETRVDVSISGQPTTQGVTFTYELTNPMTQGKLYWVLSNFASSLSAEDIRNSNGQLHSGCSGSAPQVDENVHMVDLQCALT